MLLPVYFFANKVFGNIHPIYSIRFTKVSLKLQGLLKFKHFGGFKLRISDLFYLTLVIVYVKFVTRLVR